MAREPLKFNLGDPQAEIFSGIMKKATQAGHFFPNLKKSREWFIKKAQESSLRPQRILNRKNPNFTEGIHNIQDMVGRLVMYQYDAKHKATLPYWDKFPMIFVVGFTDNGWYGLNMHYLNPQLRARLLDALYSILTNKIYDDTTKLKISYELLKSTMKFKIFKPTFHRYLATHVQSRILVVPVTEWQFALFLPLARFQKASEKQVWEDSLRKIGL